MALKKQKLLDSGVYGEYWKIVSERYDRFTGKCTWKIELFLDKPHAQFLGSGLGCPKEFSFIISKQESSENRTTLGYKKIKAKANELVTPPSFDGNVEDPRPFDEDLSDAEDV